jgi:hypothetical protein
MDIQIRKQACKHLKAAQFLVFMFFFPAAYAQFPMFPPAPYELYSLTTPDFIVGGYTVDWQDTTGSICWLSERVNNGSWATVPNTYSPTKTVSISRSVGTYDYQVACIDDYGGVLGPVSTVGVVSSMPTLDSLDIQLGYQFQIRSGDLNSDGKKDIYVKRTSGGNANNGVIDKTILTQNTDGDFDVVKNPTSGQFSAAGGWPIASAVDAVVNDFNVDGRVDVLLKDLDSTVSNVDDQILFSSGEFFKGLAQAATSMDFEFEKFFRDTYNWILDPNYFAQAITASLPAYNFSLDIGVYFCSYWFGFPTCLNVGHALFEQTVTLAMLGLSGYETIAEAEQGLASALGFASYDTFECALVCGWIEFYGFYSSTIFTFHDVWTPTTESPGFDDINFSSRARDIADITAGMLAGSETETGGMDKISDISFDSIGVAVGGICIGGLFHEPELLDPEDCRGYELFAVFSRTAPETEGVEKRQPNVVYITGHRVGWIGPFHLATEYSESSVVKTTLSAGPVGGKLVSGINRESDFTGNVTFGTTISNLGLSSAPYFLQMLVKYNNYGNHLNYDLFPQPGTDGYNSNSYIHGLINATSGGSTLEFNQFVGGNKPVPSNKFD